MTKRAPAVAMAAIAVAIWAGIGTLALANMRAATRAPQRPATVAHCLVGGMGPGQVSRFVPCQDIERYGRL